MGNSEADSDISVPTNLALIRNVLTTHFNETELRNLCFDMQIDYESLPGQAKDDKARELVRYCQRRDRYQELVDICRKLHPKVFNSGKEHESREESSPIQGSQAEKPSKKRKTPKASLTPNEKQQIAVNHFQRAERLMGSGKYEQAIEVCSDALKVYPDLREATRKLLEIIENILIPWEMRYKAAQVVKQDLRPAVRGLPPVWCNRFNTEIYTVGTHEEVENTGTYAPLPVLLTSFAISRFPITVYQFREFVRTGAYDEERWWTVEGWTWKTKSKSSYGDYQNLAIRPRAWNKSGYNRDNQPVTSVSLFEAEAFCKWLTEKCSEHLEPGEIIRLPTEAEWEIAALYYPQTSSVPDNSLGIGEQISKNKLNWWEDLKDSERNKPLPVGLCDPESPCGARDMFGNIWELCYSSAGKEDYPDKSFTIQNSIRYVYNQILPESIVARGGLFDGLDNTPGIRRRRLFYPNDQRSYLGFRVCKTFVESRDFEQRVAFIRTPIRSEVNGMSEHERQHIVELLELRRRRLGELEKQAATFGLHAPPHVVMELEDIRRAIAGLESQLDRARAIPVGLFSFARETIDASDARVLDWTPYFPRESPPAAPPVWAATLLPALHDLWQDLAQMPYKAIALRIKAVLSAGLAFGYVFRETTGFRLWIEQQTTGPDSSRQSEWWDSHAPPEPKANLLNEEARTLHADAADCLIELAISQDTERAVDAWLTTAGLPLARRLVLRPPEGPGRTAVKGGAHAIALVTQIEQVINQVRADQPQGTIHLIGAMPVGLAVLIGTRLNRRGPIQCYEFYQNSYVPSCRLD